MPQTKPRFTVPMLIAVRIARFLTPLVLLVLAVLGGGGWYYAGQIDQDGLKVDPFVLSRSLQVTAVGAGSLTLRGSSHALRTPGTYGVSWSGGYGQVTGAPQGTGTVTRTFRLLTGRPPQVGDPVGVTEDAFPDDPRVALGVAVSEVTVTSPAGRFPAWYSPGRSATWVVLVHGKGASRTEMLRMMRVPVRLGLPALDITYRNDAVLPLDKSHRYQYGRTEWRDLDAAVAWAVDHGARGVVLAGASMGGSVVAEFMERSPRRSLVTGMALDAPLLCFDDAVDLAASRREVPGVGWSLPGILTWTAKRLTTLRYGVDWDALDHLDDTRWVRVPTLVVHGTADGTVPFSDSQRLARSQPGRVTLVRDDGVTHLESWNHDPAGYEDQLRRFLQGVS